MWGKVGSSWRVPVECGAGETPLSLARRAVHDLAEKTLGIDSAEVSDSQLRLGLETRLRIHFYHGFSRARVFDRSDNLCKRSSTFIYAFFLCFSFRRRKVT